MQAFAGRRVVVIFSRESLQVTKQGQPRAVSHLLRGAKIQYAGEAVKAEPSEVSEKESSGYEGQPRDTTVWNYFIDQKSDDQRIKKHQNARRNHAQVTSKMQANEWLHLRD